MSNKINITKHGLESLACIDKRLVDQYYRLEKARFRQYNSYGEVDKVTEQLYQMVAREVRSAMLLNAIGRYKRPKRVKKKYRSRAYKPQRAKRKEQSAERR